MLAKSTTLGKRPAINVEISGVSNNNQFEMEDVEAQVSSEQLLSEDTKSLSDIYIYNLEHNIIELVAYIGYAMKYDFDTGISYRIRNSGINILNYNDINQIFNEYYLLSENLPNLLSSNESKPGFKYVINADKVVEFLASMLHSIINVNETQDSIFNRNIFDTIFLLYTMIQLHTNDVCIDNVDAYVYSKWILAIIKHLLRLVKGNNTLTDLKITYVKLLDTTKHLHKSGEFPFLIHATKEVMFRPLIQLGIFFNDSNERDLLCYRVQSNVQHTRAALNSWYDLLISVTRINSTTQASYSQRMRKYAKGYTSTAARLKAEEDEIEHSEMGTSYLRRLIIEELLGNYITDIKEFAKETDLPLTHMSSASKLTRIDNLNKAVVEAWMQYVTKTKLDYNSGIVLEQFIRIFAALCLLREELLVGQDHYDNKDEFNDAKQHYFSKDYLTIIPNDSWGVFRSIDGRNGSAYQYLEAYTQWADNLAPRVHRGQLLYMEIRRAHMILDCRLPIDIPCVEEWWYLKGDPELIQSARDRRLPVGEYADILNRTRVVTFTPFVTTLTAGLIALIASVLEKNQKLYTLPLILIGLSIDILYSWGCIDGRIGTFMWKNVKHSWTMFSTQSSINKAQSNYYTTQKNGPMAVTPSDSDIDRKSISNMMANIYSLSYKDYIIAWHSLSDATKWLANAMSRNVCILDRIIEAEIFYTNFSQWENNIKVLSTKENINSNQGFSLTRNTPYGSSKNNQDKVSTTKTLYGKHSVTITGSVGQILKEKSWLLRVPFGKEVTEDDNN